MPLRGHWCGRGRCGHDLCHGEHVPACQDRRRLHGDGRRRRRRAHRVGLPPARRPLDRRARRRRPRAADRRDDGLVVRPARRRGRRRRRPGHPRGGPGRGGHAARRTGGDERHRGGDVRGGRRERRRTHLPRRVPHPHRGLDRPPHRHRHRVPQARPRRRRPPVPCGVPAAVARLLGGGHPGNSGRVALRPLPRRGQALIPEGLGRAVARERTPPLGRRRGARKGARPCPSAPMGPVRACAEARRTR
ncbi:hypothetical protein EDD29_3771 [Actinocorallia herbida]|uniref:Uncharacterized protein n=1 Tax=Actinocorallia herbida TaxID=58109 RepID=A0A3N1CZJ8_9ACTN|nr:hypothetical protein EDD29_3771 [Actinocorallia herbida]